MANSTYYFPESLNSDNFALRTMTIGVFELRTFVDTYSELKERATKAYDEIIKGETYVSSIEEITKKYRGSIITNITLPIPNELSDSTAHQWNVESGFAKTGADSFGLTAVQDGVIARLANLDAKSKPLVNPGYFQNYTGTEPRSFSFSYNFVPNSSDEAEQLVEIIRLLKKYSSPTETASLLLTAPHFFSVTFGNQKLQGLTNIRPCVLSSIEVNYSGSGYLETTMDGMPKNIIMSLTFNEIRAITSSDWGE